MTHLPRHGEAGPGATRPPAVLSRLLLLLVLLLFGMPQGHADSRLGQGDPVAQSAVDQAQGVLSVQRILLRAQLPEDDTPDMVAPCAADATAFPDLVTAIAPALDRSSRPVAFRIQPPVRGPPVA